MQANELFTQPNTILLDGGMGTMLQAAGLKLGARPEELNITDPQLIESIHSRYAAAGLLAFLVVVGYLDVLRHIIGRDYWDGLKVVPIVMAAEIMMPIESP